MNNLSGYFFKVLACIVAFLGMFSFLVFVVYSLNNFRFSGEWFAIGLGVLIGSLIAAVAANAFGDIVIKVNMIADDIHKLKLNSDDKKSTAPSIKQEKIGLNKQEEKSELEKLWKRVTEEKQEKPIGKKITKEQKEKRNNTKERKKKPEKKNKVTPENVKKIKPKKDRNFEIG